MKLAHCLRSNTSSTSIRTAGAARIRCCSARRNSGSAPSKQSRTKPLKKSTRWSGFRRGAATASLPWCANAMTGAFPVSAVGVCRFRFSTARTAAKPLISQKSNGRLLPSFFAKEGSDAWYQNTMPKEILPEGTKCRNAAARNLPRNTISWTCGSIPDAAMRPLPISGPKTSMAGRSLS